MTPDGKARRQLRKPRHGKGLLSIGNPGNKGGGRPPDDFYPWLRGVLNDPRCRKRFAAILHRGTDLSLFLKAMEWGYERLYGKPEQPIRAVPELRLVIEEAS